jgi:hypothetical protein
VNKVISYATNNFKQSQKILNEKALLFGADEVISYGPRDIDELFVKKNIKILSSPVGAGLWLWKPYFIFKTLQESNYGDKIMYCDAGMYPIDNLDNLFVLLDTRDLALFQVHHKKVKDWTNERCIKKLNCSVEIENKEQVCGAPQLYKKTDHSLEFVSDLLSKCQDYDLIGDFGNRNHRHDQSVLSILAHQKEIEIFRDPSQWGNSFPRNNSIYPQMFNLHRGKL